MRDLLQTACCSLLAVLLAAVCLAIGWGVHGWQVGQPPCCRPTSPSGEVRVIDQRPPCPCRCKGCVCTPKRPTGDVGEVAP